MARTKSKEPSERQQAILQFVTDYSAEFGRPPTVREIGAGTNISSTSVVRYNVGRLIEFGLLERDPEIARGIRLPQPQNEEINAGLAKDLADSEEELRLLRMQVTELQIELRDTNRISMIWIERWASLVGGSHELVKLLSPDSERPVGAADTVDTWYWSTDLQMPVMVGNKPRDGYMTCLVLPRDLAYHMMGQPYELEIENLLPLVLGVDEI